MVDDREMPDINCQYLVAGTLIDRAFTFAMAHDDDRMADPAIQALRDCTELVPDPDRAGVRTADVTVTLRDGTSRQRFIGAVRGTVDDPMTDDEVTAKAVDLMEPVLGSATTKALMARLWSLDDCADIAELTAPLSGAALTGAADERRLSSGRAVPRPRPSRSGRRTWCPVSADLELAQTALIDTVAVAVAAQTTR